MIKVVIRAKPGSGKTAIKREIWAALKRAGVNVSYEGRADSEPGEVPVFDAEAYKDALREITTAGGDISRFPKADGLQTYSAALVEAGTAVVISEEDQDEV